MYLRKKFKVFYLSMLLLTIFIFICISMGIFNYYKNEVGSAYKVNFRANPYKDFIDRDIDTTKSLRILFMEDPSKIEDRDYLYNIDKQLNAVHQGIVVRKGKDIIYSTTFIKDTNIVDDLPEFSTTYRSNIPRPFISDNKLLVRQMGISFSDGTTGSLFILTDLSFLERIIVRFILTEIAAILIIIIITNILLTFLVSKNIIKPLETLKNAASQIQVGNLDFTLNPHSSDEIGEVYDAFEEMRSNLKVSKEIQDQYENNRKELISSISHDLKTPITAIKGYVEGIMDGVADTPEKMDKYISTIYSKASDLDKLIDELFLVSKLDLNKLPFNFENIDIVSYLGDCIDELTFDVQKKNVSLEFEMSDNIKRPLLVAADREKLRRVIINIIENSCKYMDKEQGKIKMFLKDNGSHVLLEIKDNGKGIPAESLPFIFDRFYRVDPSRNVSTGGSGLGLAIAKLIIDEHGGEIYAASSESQGTSISFTLKKVTGSGDLNEKDSDN